MRADRRGSAEGTEAALRVAVSALVGVVSRLPLPVARALGRRVGDLLWIALSRRRAIALRNLALAFADRSPGERRRIGRRACQHLGVVAAEVCRALREPLETTLARVNVEGLEHVQRVMTGHGRALLVSAHLGNWELLALAYRLSGHPLSVVVRPLDLPVLDGVVHRLRIAAGADMIDKRQAVRPVLEALRRGRLVALLLDQNASRKEGVFVPFFGRPASTSRSAATLALRTGAPIVPLFIRREPDGRHRITIRPPLLPPPGAATEAAVTELTARCTEVIEAAIREAPEQWLWMHDRWRTRPPAEGAGRDVAPGGPG